MSLLERIDFVIDAVENCIETLKKPSDATGYQAGWIAGALHAWRFIPASLKDIRRLTPIPAYIDQWIVCPECGAVHDPDPEPPEFVLGSDGYYIWIGPSSCSSCGQALDLTALNVPDKDSTFGLPNVAVDLLRDLGMLGDKDEPTEDSTP